ncbi:metallophosphoesterase domain-containing protein 1 [Plakobranchus ocellatus]|uniref:Metallophosphoesterase domain-containing protein 1 n=1 Tax=Plakobranchus ocellatus TaxID=259542 RepID=A0AAV4C5F0_9GAST|nr:metallophosphoesterase domain-containing protein 1 [Plakobranchus ocellatus]
MEHVTRVGHVETSTASSPVIRIVHISDTHLSHNSLTPPRPLSGNISIQRSDSTETPNNVVDESGKDAFTKRSTSLESREDGFHKGGTFLSSVRKPRINNCEIPCGNVLVHSGDFDWSKQSGGFLRSDNFEEIVQLMNDFFDRFPHKVKIFVAGNHEISLDGKKLLTVQERLTSAVYLYNSSFTYEGINFYGAPYTPFRFITNARGFIRTSGKIASHWRDIPSKTDILVTHSPPYGILDLGTKWTTRKLPRLTNAWHAVLPDRECDICGASHPGRDHWGCPHLREEVLIRIKPTLHLFGHVHECNGVTTRKGITFSNAAYANAKRPRVFDYYLPS